MRKTARRERTVTKCTGKVCPGDRQECEGERNLQTLIAGERAADAFPPHAVCLAASLPIQKLAAEEKLAPQQEHVIEAALLAAAFLLLVSALLVRA